MGTLLRLLILLTLAGTAQAEQVKGFGDLSVHYIALNSTGVPANGQKNRTSRTESLQ